jgi:biotin transport system substrate-specific component
VTKERIAMSMKLRTMILAALFAVLTAIGTYIRIPLPVVPLTLQVFFVYLAGILLGSRGGALSQLFYMLLGLVGLPVFTAGGGLQTLLHPTFGYIVGFVAAAWVAGRFMEFRRTGRFADYVVACLLGLGCLYALGVTGLYLNLNLVAGKSIGLLRVIQIGAVPFIAGDLVKAFAAAALAAKIGPRVAAFTGTASR